MKYITSILTLITLILSAFITHAQLTNPDPVTLPGSSQLATNTPEKPDYGSYELTLGGGGFTNPKTHDTQFGLDTSLSTDPFAWCPALWVGAAQNLSWEPLFAGETDLFSDYSWHVYGQLYLNTGWWAGLSYAIDSVSAWHTGPEVSFEYYVGDSSFIFGGPSLDMSSRDVSTVLYKFGIGVTW